MDGGKASNVLDVRFFEVLGVGVAGGYCLVYYCLFLFYVF